MRLERSAYLLLLYCDQVDLPILLSVSSAVVLVISEALKGHSNQSRFPCQPQGCVPHITPYDVWLSLFIYMSAIILMGYIIIKFPYNARSDWLKQRTLSEYKGQVNDIKVIPWYCIAHPYCARFSRHQRAHMSACTCKT